METPQINDEPDVVYIDLESPQRNAEEILGRLLAVVQKLEESSWHPKMAIPVIDIDA